MRCRVGDPRLAYLAELWATGSDSRVAQHVQLRVRWGEAASSGIRMVSDMTKLPYCDESTSERCLTMDDPKPPDWRFVARLTESLLLDAGRIGESLCQSWKALGSALGEHCRAETADYVLSFGQNLGSAEPIAGTAGPSTATRR